MKNFITTFFFSIVSLLSFSQCPPVFDQGQFSSWAGSGALIEHWQSFTAGATGDLSQIIVISNGGINTTLTLEIYAGTGTSGTLLYSETKAFNLTGSAPQVQWDIDCATMPTVTIGTVYTIRIQGGLNASYNTTNPYTGGYYYNSSSGALTGSDMSFKTYVSNLNKPNPALTSINPTCNGGNDGQMTATLTLSNPPYTYNWLSGITPIGSTSTISGFTSGTYSLIVEDGNLCLSCEQFITLTDPPAIFISAGADQTICSGDSANINSTEINASTFSWSPSAGLSSVNTLSTIASPTSTTTYLITATDLLGCYMTDNITVNVNPLPNVIAPVDYQLCDGSPTTLSATGTATTYTWDNGITDNVSFTPAVGSYVYVVTGSDGNSCTNKDTVNISVFPNPNVTLSSLANFCDNQQAYNLVEGFPTGGIYSGTPVTSGILYPNQGNIGINSIGYLFTDANNCSDSVSQNIVIYAAPSITTTADQTICEGEEITLIGAGTLTFIWDNGIIDGSSFIPNVGSVTYTAIGEDSNGCKDTSQTTITVNALPILTVSSNQIFCLGDVIELTASGADSYNWENGDGIINTYSVSPTGTVDISVIGTTLGCNSEKTITLKLDDPNNVSAGDDISICAGFGVNLNASGGVEYNWFGPNDFNEDKQDSYVLIDSSAFYYVKIITNDGCVYTDSIFVTATVGGNCSIDFSNTITPNNDGINDTWVIEGIESFPENTVTIFNRWGDAVFEEDNYDNNNVKWDGINTLGNEIVNGTYFYTIELKNGPTYSGWIELIK